MTQEPAKFNIIDCAAASYRLVWDERGYLLRLAGIPILIKFICYIVSLYYNESGNVIRMSLFMLPSYFAEGWMLCHFIRLITQGQRRPYQMTGDEVADLKAARTSGLPLIRGVLAFVLINLFMALFFMVMMSFVPPEMLKQGTPINPEDIPQSAALGMMVMLALVFVLFRFVWIYIPMAAGFHPKSYIDRTHKLSMTFKLIGVWAMCFIPTIYLMQMIISPGVVEAAGNSPVTQMAMGAARVSFDTLKNLIVTGGITFAVLYILGIHKKERA